MSVFKRLLPDGSRTDFYYFKFKYRGQQIYECCQTANKNEAEARERDARKAAIAGTWGKLKEAVLIRTPASVSMRQVLLTYREKATALPSTVEHNINQLQLLCAPTYPETPLEQLTTSQLTAAVVRNFKSTRLAGKSGDKLAQERTKTTINSIYAQARSVFSKEMLAHYKDAGLEINVEQITEFKSVPMCDVAVKQYKRPSIDLLTAMLRAAFVGDSAKGVKSLREADANCYKAFLLSLGTGLRKAGASHARYSWIGEQHSAPISALMAEVLKQQAGGPAIAIAPEVKAQRVLNVTIDEDFQPKGKDEQSIPLDDFVFSELTELRVPASDPNAPDYILHGPMTERCELVWRRLAAWMRGLGWERRLAAHELRKLFGAEIASAFGLYAAQKLLGHKDAKLTSARYADMNNLPKVAIFGR